MDRTLLTQPIFFCRQYAGGAILQKLRFFFSFRYFCIFVRSSLDFHKSFSPSFFLTLQRPPVFPIILLPDIDQIVQDKNRESHMRFVFNRGE